MFRDSLIVLILILCTCINKTLRAQNTKSFKCERSEAIQISSLLISPEDYIEKNISHIKAPKKKTKKALIEKYNYLKTIVNNKTVLRAKTVENELNLIVNKILKANPEISSNKFRMLYNKDYVPNAASFGSNIFFIYSGLFEILENDEQLAFVLCHEIAHELLNHSEKTIAQSINHTNSKSSKKTTLDLYRKSRDLELEADALGYKLYLNLNYTKTEAIKALKLLKISDSTLFSKTINVKSQLNFEDYPFKSFWIKKKEKLFRLKNYKSDFRNMDSLRTHPNIDVRIKTIMAIESNPSGNQSPISKIHISKIKRWQKNNYLCLIKDDERYDLTLLFALEKYFYDNTDIFAAETIANSLYLIYQAKKKKQFSKFIPPLNPFSTHQTFAELKLFLKNTEAREIRRIGMSFCNSIHKKSDELIKTLNKFKQHNE